MLKMRELYERSNIYELLLMQEANRMSVISNKEYIKFLKTKYKEMEKTNSPTIDAVDVIRCKDCRHWDREDEYCTDGEGLCGGITENDYCSRAVRRKKNEVEE